MRLQIELDFTSDPLGIKGLMGLNCLAVSEQDFKILYQYCKHPQESFFPSAWTLTRFFWSLKLTEIYRDRKKDAYWLRSRMWHIFKLFLCIQRFLLIFVKKNNYNPSLDCRVFIASDKMLLIFSPDIQTVEITLYKEKKD